MKFQMKLITSLSILLSAGLVAKSVQVKKNIDVKEIISKLDDLYRSDSSKGKLELISKSESQTRHLKLRMWSKGKDKSLIIIDEPARETGIKTLKVDKNLWNYIPNISKTIRIPPSMMLSPWMGTDFTNDDLVKDSSYENDYTSSITGSSNEPKGIIVTMKAKPNVVGRWLKIEWIVRDDNFLPLLSRQFDQKGQLARTLEFSEVKKLGGREIPTRLKLISVDQPGHQTEIHYLEMEFNAQVPDSMFSLSQLERK